MSQSPRVVTPIQIVGIFEAEGINLNDSYDRRIKPIVDCLNDPSTQFVLSQSASEPIGSPEPILKLRKIVADIEESGPAALSALEESLSDQQFLADLKDDIKEQLEVDQAETLNGINHTKAAIAAVTALCVAARVSQASLACSVPFKGQPWHQVAEFLLIKVANVVFLTRYHDISNSSRQRIVVQLLGLAGKAVEESAFIQALKRSPNLPFLRALGVLKTQ